MIHVRAHTAVMTIVAYGLGRAGEKKIAARIRARRRRRRRRRKGREEKKNALSFGTRRTRDLTRPSPFAFVRPSVARRHAFGSSAIRIASRSRRVLLGRGGRFRHTVVWRDENTTDVRPGRRCRRFFFFSTQRPEELPPENRSRLARRSYRTEWRNKMSKRTWNNALRANVRFISTHVYLWRMLFDLFRVRSKKWREKMKRKTKTQRLAKCQFGTRLLVATHGLRNAGLGGLCVARKKKSTVFDEWHISRTKRHSLINLCNVLCDFFFRWDQ